jgi:hypothetical protein
MHFLSDQQGFFLKKKVLPPFQNKHTSRILVKRSMLLRKKIHIYLYKNIIIALWEERKQKKTS